MPRCDGLAAVIAERADGNPFFAEEIVRDLAERGAVRGTRGSYLLHGDVADIDGAGNLASGHRGPRRPAQPGGQAHARTPRRSSGHGSAPSW